MTPVGSTRHGQERQDNISRTPLADEPGSVLPGGKEPVATTPHLPSIGPPQIPIATYDPAGPRLLEPPEIRVEIVTVFGEEAAALRAAQMEILRKLLLWAGGDDWR
ncbi:hypothetical protein [Nonomuraea sp. NPDC049400]|uniref:hypothetical protein n=1 Tax=Nonomuraea sp. NPDC049400 TaxID=3364352 RepID=UPI003790A0CB